MSYDVWGETQGPYDKEPVSVFWENYTSNCARMWRLAGADLAEFDGWPALTVAGEINAAIEVMRADPEGFKELNPENGWGDYESCLEFLTKLRDGAARFPDAVVRVSH